MDVDIQLSSVKEEIINEIKAKLRKHSQGGLARMKGELITAPNVPWA